MYFPPKGGGGNSFNIQYIQFILYVNSRKLFADSCEKKCYTFILLNQVYMFYMHWIILFILYLL